MVALVSAVVVPTQRTPTRESLVAAMLLGLSLLHCCNKKETVAELDEPIRVEWIYRKTFTGGGRFGGVSETGTIEVERTPPVKIEAGCWEPKPALAATTDEVAFRCDDGKPWRLAYLAKSGAYAFLHCDDVLGTGGKPDFASMPAFDAAAPRLVECGANDAKQRPQPNFAALFEEIRARAGDVRLADILMQSASYPFRVERKYDGKTVDDWEDGYELLPPPEKKRVDAYLEKRLADKTPPSPLLQRAVWHVTPLAPKLKDVYRARVEELIRHAKGDEGGRELMVLAARLHLLGEKDAGELACRALARDVGSAEGQLLELIALANYRCEHVRAQLEKHPCSLGYDCGEGRQRHLCTKEEVSAKLAENVERSATDRTSDATGEAPSLAAGYVFEELPKNVLLAAARRGYEGPSAGGTCYSEEAKPDEECDCFNEPLDMEAAVCELDGGTEGEYHKGCRIVIDDHAKRVRVFPKLRPDAAVPKAKPLPSASASASASAAKGDR